MVTDLQVRRLFAMKNKVCAKVSWCDSAGKNPARPKLADRPECKRAYQEVTNGTKPCKQRMVSRNASEGSKPRNFSNRNGPGVALL